LEPQSQLERRFIGKNSFSLVLDLFGTLLYQVENHNIAIGKLTANSKNVQLNLFYTLTKLTDNALIFNKKK
jgi:hypothetical protein